MPRRAIPPFLAGLMAIALCNGAMGQALVSARPVYGFSELPERSASNLVVSLSPSSPSMEFRFAPEGGWLRFVKPLELSAAPGEERGYLLELRETGGGEILRKSCTIDRKAPSPPLGMAASGLYSEALEFSLVAEEGSVIHYCLSSSTDVDGSFSVYDSGRRPILTPPKSASASWLFLAYAVDAVGNRSQLAKREYRLAAPEPAYLPPPFDSPAPRLILDTLSDLGSPRIVSSKGRVDLSYSVPSGSRLYAAVNPSQRPGSPLDFSPVEAEGSLSRLSIECPYGWSGTVLVYIALSGSSGFRSLEKPLPFLLSDLPSAPPPDEPSLAAGSAGGPVFLVFPPYAGDIRFSFDLGSLQTYRSPLLLAPDSGEVDVVWFGVDSAGLRSEVRKKTLTIPSQPPVLGLVGVQADEYRNGKVLLKPTAPGVLRYELSQDGTMPAEPGPSSPLVGDGLLVDCPAGEEHRCVIRYRGFSSNRVDAAPSEGGVLSFTLDKKAPDAPRLSGSYPGYSAKPLSISFKAEPEALVYASLEIEGKTEGFRLASEAIRLPGGNSGPVSYRIRAYAVDKAGNRSEEMQAVSYIVDIATIYVAENGSDANDGSRGNPLASLDRAIKLALDGVGERVSIRVRGDAVLGASLSISGKSLSISGGYDADWKQGGTASSTIQIARAALESRAGIFSVTSGSLSLSRLELSIKDPVGPAIVDLSRAALSIEGSLISLSSSGDVLFADMESSSLRLRDSSIVFEASRSASFVSAIGSSIQAESSSVVAKQGVRYYGAFDLEGGSLSLEQTALKSAASMGTRLLSLVDAKIEADSSLFDVSGGPGFLSIGNFEGVEGRLSNCHLLLSWAGDAVLFRTKGSGPSFVHDSFYASASKGTLRFFECDGPAVVIRNCILDCIATGGDFLVSRIAPKPGDIAADCLYGFSNLVLGEKSLRDLRALLAFNAASKEFSGKPCFTESPERTFLSLDADGFVLRPDSRCIDGAIVLGDAPGLDYSGLRRPSAQDPDVGADEFVARP